MRLKLLFSYCLSGVLVAGTVRAQPAWPQFRGPRGAGVADQAKPPIQFAPGKNVRWKTDLPVGHSSPCIWADRIFLTGFDKENSRLETLCLERSTGKTLWRKSVSAGKIEKVHEVSNPAVSTPVTDGTNVCVYFGSYGVVCYDFSGNERWTKELPMPQMRFGTGTSPILARGVLLLDMHLGKDSYLLALKVAGGETAWQTPRPTFNEGWSTPVHWQEEGVDVVGLQCAGRFTAYALKDGGEKWWVDGLGFQAVSTPVVASNIVYLTSAGVFGEDANITPVPSFDEVVKQYDADHDGKLAPNEIPADLLFVNRQTSRGAGDMSIRQMLAFRPDAKDAPITREQWDQARQQIKVFTQSGMNKTSAVAVKTGGRGDVTQSHLLWQEAKGVPEVPSPLYYRDRVYFVKNGGIAVCREAATGKLVFEERLGAIGGYYASPVGAAGRIYAASDKGMIVVFAANDQFEVLARNNLEEPIMATPAIIDNTLYVRTAQKLYAFAE